MQKIYFFILFFSIILSCKAVEEANPVSNEPNSKKNLVIIVITNYDWNKISVFFTSYVKANFENTDFVAFVNAVPESTLNKLRSYGAITVPFPEEIKKIHIYTSRWGAIVEYLKQNSDKYKMVFTSDTRDAFFQSDVFKYYENVNKPFLGVAYENGYLTQELTNVKWIKNAFGEDYFNTLTTQRIICAGTLWGTPDKVLQFAERVFSLLTSNPKAIDQAATNYIIYQEKLFENCTIISNNEDGPIMTIGIANRAFINLDKNNNIINGKGEIAAFVHQYDRHQDLTKIANDKYNTKLNEPIKIDNINPNPIKSDIKKPEPPKSDNNKPKPVKSDIKEPLPIKSDIKEPLPIKSDNKKYENNQSDDNKSGNKKSDNTNQSNKKDENGLSYFALVFLALIIVLSFVIGLIYIYRIKKQLPEKIDEKKCKLISLII